MKGGPCGTIFAAWEVCVDAHREGGSDFVAACMPHTRSLKECMEANPEYYSELSEEEGVAEAAEGGDAAVEAPSEAGDHPEPATDGAAAKASAG